MRALSTLIAMLTMQQAIAGDNSQKQMEASGIKPTRNKNRSAPRFGNNRPHQSKAKRNKRKAIARASQLRNRVPK